MRWVVEPATDVVPAGPELRPPLRLTKVRRATKALSRSLETSSLNREFVMHDVGAGPLPAEVHRTLAARHRRSTAVATRFRLLAEVDGNRTRRTRIARSNRFEGGGAHQEP